MRSDRMDRTRLSAPQLALLGLGALLALGWRRPTAADRRAAPRARTGPTARGHPSGRAHMHADAAAHAVASGAADRHPPALPYGRDGHDGRSHDDCSHDNRSHDDRSHDDRSHAVAFAGFYDGLTGLPNESALLPMLRSILGRARLQDGHCALVRIDLLGLDIIRSIAGAGAGDRVLQVIAERLGAVEGEPLSLGRGSFAVVLQQATPQAAASSSLAESRIARAAQALLQAVHEPIQLDDLPVALRCRAGVAIYPDHGISADSLSRAAEMACAAAHERHVPSLVYHAGLEPDPRSLTLLADLGHAIDEGSLGYALQPKLDLALGRFTGAEMLVRWRHPTYGPLSPGVFVPLAEKMGLIGEMSRYLVGCAARHCREWRAAGIPLSLSVNLSVNDLADPELVEAIIGEADGLDGALMLEVTETAAMHDPNIVLAAVQRLHQNGMRISLDDFGTGYSSLTYLQRLAPDEVKIDRSFISRVLESRSDRAIVRTSIQLAHDIGASVTAEGIEDSDTLAWLTDAGCDAAQGFAIARPMPVEDLLRSERLRLH